MCRRNQGDIHHLYLGRYNPKLVGQLYEDYVHYCSEFHGLERVEATHDLRTQHTRGNAEAGAGVVDFDDEGS